jgi:hypothetical protein
MPLLPSAPRPVEHPELSNFLTHLCKRCRRQRDAVPEYIRSMSAPDRLACILWQQQLRAFVTFSLGDPAVCFTEAKDEGLRFLIQRGKYEPWGLLFDRQNVYEVGGGPVW